MSLEEAFSFKKDAIIQKFKKDADEAPVADDGEEGHAATARYPTGRPFRSGSLATELSSNASSISYRKARHDKIGGGDGFWCRFLCMHLPGLSRRTAAAPAPDGQEQDKKI
ncbi:unnamed protein product [Urochloa humidicola]